MLLLLFRGKLQTVIAGEPFGEPAWPPFNGWQSFKGLAAAAAVVILLLAGLPQALSVLTVAGALLLSRRMHTRTMLGLVDWHLITLFCGLFIVVRGFNQAGLPGQGLEWLASRGFPLDNPYLLSLVSVALGNMASNVPATVLTSPHLPTGQPVVWYVLSLATTYAGNLFTIGSMANLIVIEQARPFGIHVGFLDYARAGILVTAANLAVLAWWIALRT